MKAEIYIYTASNMNVFLTLYYILYNTYIPTWLQVVALNKLFSLILYHCHKEIFSFTVEKKNTVKCFSTF